MGRYRIDPNGGLTTVNEFRNGPTSFKDEPAPPLAMSVATTPNGGALIGIPKSIDAISMHKLDQPPEQALTLRLPDHILYSYCLTSSSCVALSVQPMNQQVYFLTIFSLESGQPVYHVAASSIVAGSSQP